MATQVQSWWRSPWVGAVILVAVTFIAYLPVWHAGFIWDDDAYVTNSHPLRSRAGLLDIWFVPGSTEQYYPLTVTTFWIEYHLWHLAPLGYHLDNVALHSINAVLVWFILRRLGVPGAWLAAAIFALHPVNVETAAWITERKNTLSGFFYLSSILAALNFWRLDATVPDAVSGRVARAADEASRGWRSYWLACGLYACALLSKTAAVPLPLVLVLILWWKFGRIRLRDHYPIGLLLLLGLMMAGVTLWVEANFVGTKGATWDFSLLQRCLLAGRIFWFYLFELFWPHPLMFIYPKWDINVANVLGWVPSVGALITLAVLFGYRNGPLRPVFLALVYFSVMLFPVLGFFMLYFFRYSFVEDHLQYLAGIGPIALVSAGLVTLFDLAGKASPWLKSLAGGALLALLGVLTWRQCGMYTDLETLFRVTLQRNPGAWMAYNNLGTILMEKGQVDDAVANFQKALELHPNYEEAYNNLGLVFMYRGQTDDAISEYRRSLQVNPDYALAHNNLGNALMQQGFLDQAISQYQKAVELGNHFADAYNNLGLAVAKSGKPLDAIGYFQQALEIEPDHPKANLNLGNVYTQEGELDKALACYKNAFSAQHNNADAANNIGFVLLQMNQVDKAVAYFQKALEIDPRNANAYNNLASAAMQQGRMGAAVGLYLKSLEIRPSDVGVLNNVAWILATCPDSSLRDGVQAVEMADRANQLSGGQNPIVLGGLAAAYAEAGQFSAALDTAQRALDIASAQGKVKEVKVLKSQMQFYRQNAPFRDSSLKNRP